MGKAAEEPEAFCISAWKQHLRQEMLPEVAGAVFRERTLRLIRDASMDGLWKRLADHANDAKPFAKPSTRRPDWTRCLSEFSAGLIYSYTAAPLVQQRELEQIVFRLKQLQHKISLHPRAAALGRQFLTERADEPLVATSYVDANGLIRPVPERHRHALLLNDVVIARAIETLAAADVSDKRSGTPRFSLKGPNAERNAIAFHMKYSVVAQWFEGSHHSAVAKGLFIVRPELGQMSADAVRNLRPINAKAGEK